MGGRARNAMLISQRYEIMLNVGHVNSYGMLDEVSTEDVTRQIDIRS